MSLQPDRRKRISDIAHQMQAITALTPDLGNASLPGGEATLM
jgi:hypothetical protein